MIALLSEKWESPQILSRQNEMFHVEHFCNCAWNSDSPRRKPVQVSPTLGNTLLTKSPFAPECSTWNIPTSLGNGPGLFVYASRDIPVKNVSSTLAF